MVSTVFHLSSNKAYILSIHLFRMFWIINYIIICIVTVLKFNIFKFLCEFILNCFNHNHIYDSTCFHNIIQFILFSQTASLLCRPLQFVFTFGFVANGFSMYQKLLFIVNDTTFFLSSDDLSFLVYFSFLFFFFLD